MQKTESRIGTTTSQLSGNLLLQITLTVYRERLSDSTTNYQHCADTVLYFLLITMARRKEIGINIKKPPAMNSNGLSLFDVGSYAMMWAIGIDRSPMQK